MRQDGFVTFWQFQYRINGSDKWNTVSFNSGNGYSTPLFHPKWREHTACGECWQKYGYHGFLSEQQAFDAISVVRAEHQDKDLRILKLTKSQFTEEFMSMKGRQKR